MKPFSRSRVRLRAGRRRRRFRCSRRDGSNRRTRRARTLSFSRTAATRPRVTHAGGGSSTWQNLAVTRLRDDRTSDPAGHCIYLRAPWSGQVWSATYQPCCQEPDEYEAIFDLDKATFRRRDGDFETQLQVTVSPEDDVEVRRLSITNRGDRPREIEVTSYAEIVLARPEDDFVHPAFGKLFIETDYDPQSAGLALQPATTQPGRGHLGVPRAGRRGTTQRRSRMGNRSRAIPRPRALARQPGGARRPRALRHCRCGARSDRGAARARAARARAHSCA